ncbi:MAG: ATP-binding protein [Asticcacaulis sp.]
MSRLSRAFKAILAKIWGSSRLGRLILGLNLLSLIVLITGAMVLNEFRQGLIDNRKESLASQAELMAEVLAEVATRGDPIPQMEAGATVVLSRFIPKGQRARLYDAEGTLLADSYVVSENVDVQLLPPARKPDEPAPKRNAARDLRLQEKARDALQAEVFEALEGRRATSVRDTETGERVVSVSIPIKRVRTVLGVLTLEGGDVDAIVQAQRMAMIPFVLVALMVTIVSSLLLNRFVTLPILRLSYAANRVKLSRARAISLPDLEARQDEIGNLARSLESMTATLSRRMDAIERFAADVSHEIKNPLTSIRSAVDTLGIVSDDKAKAKLTAVLRADVLRLDRLITDISNASRLDAELSRDAPQAVDLTRLLTDIASLYPDSPEEGRVAVRLSAPPVPVIVNGQEGPLGQVFRNLLDNARSFSPPGRWVDVDIELVEAPDPDIRVRVIDEGPGIPPDNLETIFERFYTSRPKGTAFGTNSGLGLAIVRQIVEAHGGRVWAENRLASDGAVTGACFTISLKPRPTS